MIDFRVDETLTRPSLSVEAACAEAESDARRRRRLSRARETYRRGCAQAPMPRSALARLLVDTAAAVSGVLLVLFVAPKLRAGASAVTLASYPLVVVFVLATRGAYRKRLRIVALDKCGQVVTAAAIGVVVALVPLESIDPGPFSAER